MKTFNRNSQGQFASVSLSVISGRLYGYKGTVVRAGKLCSNGVRHVSFHKTLHGFVKDNELTKIDNTQVNKYLENA